MSEHHEESVDLTPGVVWTDAQLVVVRDLAAQVHRARADEAARWWAKIEALADEIDTEADVQNVLGAGNWKIAGMIGLADRVRALLDGEQR